MPVIIILILSFALPLWANTPIKSITCFDEVTSMMMKLNVTQPWMKVHEGNGFSLIESKEKNDQKFTAWLSTTEGESDLMVQKSGAFIQHSFIKKNDCKMRTLISKGEISKLFTTLDFYKTSKDNSKFVILLWSSQMAISLKQMRDLKGQKFEVPIIYVLDENANIQFAKDFIQKEKLPVSYLRQWSFVGELPATIEHYPSALFVKEGKIVKYIPGFSTPQILEKLIKDHL
ncbi:hypothetical protein ACJVC5_02340 [Peredibacter sp. HCB2-198]|uniref:hypothetical protein n=1 Tax=Peredibacter sp. HCB2-198 TaxID=3383025 RepID=UPI0038B56C22